MAGVCPGLFPVGLATAMRLCFPLFGCVVALAVLLGGTGPARAESLWALIRQSPPARGEAILRYMLAEHPRHERQLLTMWQSLDRAAPLRFSASASLLPSSNVNHVASERYLVTDFGTFLIKDGGQESPGMGLGYGADVDWIIHPRPGYRFHLRAGLSGAWFDTARLRYSEPTLSLGYDHLGGRAPWSVQTFLRDRRYDTGPAVATADHLTRGLGYAQSWRLARADRLTLRLRGAYESYAKEGYLTGPRYHAELDRAFPVGKGGRLSYGISLDRALPRKDYHRYVGVGLRVGYERPVVRGLRGGLWLGAGQQVFDTPFPLVGTRRRDRVLSLGISATFTKVRVFGQVPRVYCSARQVQSNVALYSYRSLDCSLALTVDF